MTTASRRQRGAALLALLAVIMLGGMWWLLSAIQPVNRVVLEREHNAKVLRQAKQAVLGWVAQNAMDRTDFNPGKLPCPEALGNFTMPPSVNEGVMQGFCAGALAAAVGRLPWRSLGIDKPFDADGEVLWYVVGPRWKVPNSPETPLGINSNSPNTLFVDGSVNPQAVAAIIAPGKRLVTTPIASQTAQGCAAQSQARSTFPPANSLHYLECQSIAGASLRIGVADNGSNPVFNDQVVLITAADVLAAVEPVVVARIQRDVVPQLKSAYASATWGASASDPYFPFAVSYGDPAASDFKGVVSKAEGLLPVNASDCALAAGRCDPNFVVYDTASISVTITGGNATAFTADCSASSGTQVSCNVAFSNAVCGVPCLTVDVKLQVAARNVGKTLRNLNAAAASGLTTLISPLQADGSALVTYTGTLSSGTNSGSATVTVPITAFQDHPLLVPAGPSSPDDWYWFFANQWHYVTYYAVSPDDLPGGAHNCVASSNCITVNVESGTVLSNRRALLALAGASLIGTAGSNRALTDFLDTAENTDGNTTFEQKKFSKAFNDRVFSLSP